MEQILVEIIKAGYLEPFLIYVVIFFPVFLCIFFVVFFFIYFGKKLDCLNKTLLGLAKLAVREAETNIRLDDIIGGD